MPWRGLGKKFERKKVRIAKKVELFSSYFFLVHTQLEVLLILKLIPYHEEWNNKIA